MPSIVPLVLLTVSIGLVQGTEQFWDHLDSAEVERLVRGAQEVKSLSFGEALSRKSPFGVGRGLLLVVRTDESAWGVLECQFAARKRGETVFPVVLVRRCVLVRSAGGVALVREGVEWFSGLELDCDIGQVVPPPFGGDLALSGDRPENSRITPRKDVRLWVVERLPDMPPQEGQPKEGFGRFSGKYQLVIDGDVRGMLTVESSDQGVLRGTFVSAETGEQYPVTGRFGGPEYRLRARITFPRSVQDLEVYFWQRRPGIATGIVRSQEHIYGVLLARPGKVEMPGDR